MTTKHVMNDTYDPKTSNMEDLEKRRRMLDRFLEIDKLCNEDGRRVIYGGINQLVVVDGELDGYIRTNFPDTLKKLQEWDFYWHG